MPKKILNKKEGESFESILKENWKERFLDSCEQDWKKKWFLDGEIGTVSHDPKGMTLTAGSEFKNDAHHMVLWTKDIFEGDLKIEYDYTRLDNARKCVNILYVQATGSGEHPYTYDIYESRALRKVPAMKEYFDKMNCYHISYAAFGNNDESVEQYIRARRYMPHQTGLKGSDLKPDYFPEGLFAHGEKHHLVFIKKERDIYVKVENDSQIYYCHMQNTALPPVQSGRIGLRHMFTRSAKYRNIQICNKG